jgi:hypothetical protein
MPTITIMVNLAQTGMFFQLCQILDMQNAQTN